MGARDQLITACKGMDSNYVGQKVKASVTALSEILPSGYFLWQKAKSFKKVALENGYFLEMGFITYNWSLSRARTNLLWNSLTQSAKAVYSTRSDYLLTKAFIS